MELVYTYIFVYIARRSVCIMIEMIERIVHIYVLLSFESRDKDGVNLKIQCDLSTAVFHAMRVSQELHFINCKF